MDRGQSGYYGLVVEDVAVSGFAMAMQLSRQGGIMGFAKRVWRMFFVNPPVFEP